jgi:hypothetical protein
VPTTITVRNVPDEARDELAARAASAHRSLQEYQCAELIALASRPDPEQPIARIRQRKAVTGSRLSAEEILSYRDADRR